MLLLGKIDRQLIEKYGEKAADMGKSSYKYAWAVDKHPIERERGLTIDFSLASIPTSKFDITVINCPGHQDYVKNMMTGMSQVLKISNIRIILMFFF